MEILKNFKGKMAKIVFLAIKFGMHQIDMFLSSGGASLTSSCKNIPISQFWNFNPLVLELVYSWTYLVYWLEMVAFQENCFR